jgi:hypothetical protein
MIPDAVPNLVYCSFFHQYSYLNQHVQHTFSSQRVKSRKVLKGTKVISYLQRCAESLRLCKRCGYMHTGMDENAMYGGGDDSGTCKPVSESMAMKLNY